MLKYGTSIVKLFTTIKEHRITSVTLLKNQSAGHLKERSLRRETQKKKSVRMDEITTDALKQIGDEGIPRILSMCNTIWITLANILESINIPVHDKGKKTKRENSIGGDNNSFLTCESKQGCIFCHP